MGSNYFLDYPHPCNNIGDGPEGPEVRTVAVKLCKLLLHKKLIQLNLGPRAKITGQENIVYFSTVTQVYSYGKKILIKLDNGIVIITSLGMTGRFQFSPGNHSHIHFVFGDAEKKGILNVLSNTFSLYYDDTRYMGNIKIIFDHQLPAFLAELGPDLLESALTTPIDKEKWFEIFRSRKAINKEICQVLMDQDLIAGIGNYLKSEILYYAGILPQRKVNSLTEIELEKLRVVAHQVILLSFSYGGLTIESFISPDGEIGRYPVAIYGKSKDAYNNSVVRGTTKDGRTSHWVPTLQK